MQRDELATHIGLVVEDEEATRGGTAVEGAVERMQSCSQLGSALLCAAF